MYMDPSLVVSSMTSCFHASEIEGGACRSTSASLAGIFESTTSLRLSSHVLKNEVVSFEGGSQTSINVLRRRSYMGCYQDCGTSKTNVSPFVH